MEYSFFLSSSSTFFFEAPTKLAHRLNQLVMDNDIVTLRLYVIHAKVNVNVCDYDKRTPLHVCVAEGRKECFVILMESGANCEAKDRWGSTPIDEGKRCGHEKLVERMMQKKGGGGGGQ